MSQYWTDDTYAASHTGTTDLQNMENNFQCLKSMFSGSSAPSWNVVGMPWFDTTNKILKIRNSANSAWLGVMYGNSNNKIWMYSNAATDGWTVYSTLNDRILAIKGGTQAYNISGGTAGGTWTYNHTHTLTTSENGEHVHKTKNYTSGEDDQVFDSDGVAVDVTVSSSNQDIGIAVEEGGGGGEEETLRYFDAKDWYTDVEADHTHTATTANNAMSTWRPAAAVGTLQYPNT